MSICSYFVWVICAIMKTSGVGDKIASQCNDVDYYLTISYVAVENYWQD